MLSPFAAAPLVCINHPAATCEQRRSPNPPLATKPPHTCTCLLSFLSPSSARMSSMLLRSVPDIPARGRQRRGEGHLRHPLPPGRPRPPPYPRAAWLRHGPASASPGTACSRRWGWPTGAGNPVGMSPEDWCFFFLFFHGKRRFHVLAHSCPNPAPGVARGTHRFPGSQPKRREIHAQGWPCLLLRSRVVLLCCVLFCFLC